MENSKRSTSRPEVAKRLNLLESIRKTCENVLNESLTWDSFSDTLSDNGEVLDIGHPNWIWVRCVK